MLSVLEEIPCQRDEDLHGCHVECYCSVDCQRVNWKATRKVDCLALCTALRSHLRA